MKLAALMMAWTLNAFSSICTNDANTFCGVQVTKVYDGDTLTANIASVHPLLGNRVGIRINGIDTPELRTKDLCEKRLGLKARDLVRSMVRDAKQVDLHNVGRGKYFRIVADVVVDGIDIRSTLIARGLGYPYDGGTKKKVNWCEIKEQRP